MSKATGKRVSGKVWERIRADHEALGMSFNQLQQKYGVNRSTISRKARQQGWNQDGVQGAIATVVQSVEQAEKSIQAANAELSEVCESPVVQQVATQQTQQLLTIKGLILSGAVKGQQAINDALNSAIQQGSLEVLVPVVDAHSRVTGRYAKTLFGDAKPAPEGQEDIKEKARNDLAQRLLIKHGGRIPK